MSPVEYGKTYLNKRQLSLICITYIRKHISPKSGSLNKSVNDKTLPNHRIVNSKTKANHIYNSGLNISSGSVFSPLILNCSFSTENNFSHGYIDERIEDILSQIRSMLQIT